MAPAPVSAAAAASLTSTTAAMSNLTLCATHDCQLQLVKGERPKPKRGEALVHVRATGVCGSDIHFWKHGGLGDWTIKDKCALGHESGGVVLEVGEGVTHLAPGDKVAIEPGVPCMKPTCEYCLEGKYNLCRDVVFYSVPPDHGTLTRYHVHPAAFLHKCPDSMTFEEIACLEPLSVTLRATLRAEIRLGMPVVITGAGPIGVVQLLCASAAGASPILITDLSAERLAFAKSLVPDVLTYQVAANAAKAVEKGEVPPPPKEPRQIAEEVVAMLTEKAGFGKRLMPEVVMECTGVEASMAVASYACRPNGTVFVIGVGGYYQNIPFMHLSTHEIDVKYLFRYKNTWPTAIRLVSSKKVDVARIVTHRFPLEEADEAVRSSSDRTRFSVKTVILDGRIEDIEPEK